MLLWVNGIKKNVSAALPFSALLIVRFMLLIDYFELRETMWFILLKKVENEVVDIFL